MAFRRDTVVQPRYRRGGVVTTTGHDVADRPPTGPTRCLRPDELRPDAENRLIDSDSVSPVGARDPGQFAHLTEFAQILDEWLKPRR